MMIDLPRLSHALRAPRAATCPDSRRTSRRGASEHCRLPAYLCKAGIRSHGLQYTMSLTHQVTDTVAANPGEPRRAPRASPADRAVMALSRPADPSPTMGPMAAPTRKVLLAKPRGYCAGVDRAVQAVERRSSCTALPSTCASRSCTTRTWSGPWRSAARSSSRRPRRCPRARSWSSPRTGSRPQVHEEAAGRSLRTIDATCPLVTKVHNEARRFAAQGYDILLIGHEGHEEVVGTTGEAPDHIHLVDGPDDSRQRRRCATRPRSSGCPRPRCRWTRPWRRSPRCASGSRSCSTRRATTSATPPRTGRSRSSRSRPRRDLVIVVGSANSSNSVRLVEVARDARRRGRVPGRRRLGDRPGLAGRRHAPSA